MYASIRRYEGVTDPVRAARRVKEEFVPLLSGMDGFVAYFWVDAGDGVMLSTSVFESRAAADESNRKAAAWAEAIAEALPARRAETEEHEAPRH